MRKNSRWLIAQSDNHYDNTDEYRGNVFSYLFLLSKAKNSGEVVWDMNGGEWILDGVGHSTFRLELFS